MTKIVAMIPARLGSKRIKSKNLRLLAGKPLVCHVVDKCKEAGVFDDIYINSEADIFKNIAEEYGVKFYKRAEYLASDEATNDEFAFDFIEHVDCDILVQVNPTAPLVQSNEIRDFVTKMVQGDYDTLLSVKREQVEGFFKGEPINFDRMKQMPRSQDLEPIYLHCSTMFAWKSDVIREKMKKYNCSTYGADSKVGFYVFDSFANIDIDNESDFALAETIINYMKRAKDVKPEYYSLHPQQKEME